MDNMLLIIFATVLVFLPRIWANSDDRCGGYRVNDRHTICCDGILYVRSGFRQACCGSVGYDSHYYTCCGRTIIHKGSKKHARCCGDKAYDAHSQHCKAGYVVDRTGIGSTCCETYNGWKCCNRGEGCCSGNERNLVGSDVVDVPGFRPACCSMKSRTDISQCCKQAIEKAWVVPPCCEQEDTMPICCVKPSGDWHCCTPQEGYCCESGSTRVKSQTHQPGLIPTRGPKPIRVPHIETSVSWVLPQKVTKQPRSRPTQGPQTRPQRKSQPQRSTHTRSQTTPYPTLAPTLHPTQGPQSTCCSSVSPHPSCCSSLRRRPQCCSTIYRTTCCISTTRLPYCCQRTPQQSRLEPPNQISPVNRRQSCCFNRYPNHFCCDTSALNHPQRPRPSNACCTGAARPTCCYSWYQRSTCCEPPPSRSSETSSQDDSKPFDGQVASCCSSSSKQQCCQYGKAMTGQLPVCCDSMMEEHTTVSLTTLEPQFSFEDDDDSESDSTVVVIEEKADKSEEPPLMISHSCCGVDETELNLCCANGFRRTGIQAECCERKKDHTPDKRGDIPGDLAYLYLSDDTEEESCCNQNATELDECCRTGYFNTGQAFKCCQLRLNGHDIGVHETRTQQPALSRTHHKTESTCCGMTPMENQHCCQKSNSRGSTPICCRVERLQPRAPITFQPLEMQTIGQQQLSCCAETLPIRILQCCQNGLHGLGHLPDCCARYQTLASNMRPRGNHAVPQIYDNYFRRNQFPFPRQPGHQRRDYTRDICGTRMYDTRIQICCSGVPVVKHGISPKCCGRIAYDAVIFRCCPGNRVRRYCGRAGHQQRYYG